MHIYIYRIMLIEWCKTWKGHRPKRWFGNGMLFNIFFSRSPSFSTKLEGRILSPSIQVWFFPLNSPVQKSSNLTWTERINFHWNFLMIFNPNKPLKLFMDTSVFVPKSSFWAPSFLGAALRHVFLEPQAGWVYFADPGPKLWRRMVGSVSWEGA